MTIFFDISLELVSRRSECTDNEWREEVGTGVGEMLGHTGTGERRISAVVVVVMLRLLGWWWRG